MVLIGSDRLVPWAAHFLLFRNALQQATPRVPLRLLPAPQDPGRRCSRGPAGPGGHRDRLIDAPRHRPPRHRRRSGLRARARPPGADGLRTGCRGHRVQRRPTARGPARGDRARLRAHPRLRPGAARQARRSRDRAGARARHRRSLHPRGPCRRISSGGSLPPDRECLHDGRRREGGRRADGDRVLAAAAERRGQRRGRLRRASLGRRPGVRPGRRAGARRDGLRPARRGAGRHARRRGQRVRRRGEAPALRHRVRSTCSPARRRSPSSPTRPPTPSSWRPTCSARPSTDPIRRPLSSRRPRSTAAP